ncbi:hypothetical protein [Aggregatibacter kilianii]|uniref:hypothetical protein n=1 Tax=Aggregatibacter kilianii TaxID=2025884 RepID=UPI000D64D9E8|nr:hypothetical protein [Aggregatibacter kilianii]
MTHPIQQAIEAVAQEVHKIKETLPSNDKKQSEIGAVPFSLIDFTNGYPFTRAEIPFKTNFPNEKILVRLHPIFNALTQTSFVFNIYDLTRTGFKIRMNVKNVANKGLLKELYYEAIYIGESSND